MTSSSRDFRVLTASSVLSKIADYGLLLVAPLAILDTTGSSAGAIFAVALRGVAFVLSPFIGSIIDRFDRRTVFVLAQAQQGACIVVVGVFIDDPVTVSIALLLSGLGSVAVSVAGQFVMVPQLVAQESRAEAVSKLSFAGEVSRIVGFLGGGGAVATLGFDRSIVVIVILYAGAGAVACALPRMPVTAPRSGVLAGIGLGFSWLRRPEISNLVLTMGLSNLALGALASVLVTWLGSRGLDSTVIAGTLAGGLALGAIGSRLGGKALRSVSIPVRLLAFQGAAGAAFLVLALVPSPWIKVVAFGAVQFSLGLSNVVSIVYRQDSIPTDMAGRVNSVIRMFIAGAIPLSGAIYAAVETTGGWLWGPALVVEGLALAVWLRFVRVQQKRTLDRGVSGFDVARTEGSAGSP